MPRRPHSYVLAMAIVLVTGGSSGIGLATVRRLAAAGHQVFSASRRPDRNGVPAGVTPLVLDLADPAAAAPAVAAVVEAAGRLDVLVNNAGIGAVGSTEETSDDDAHRILEVNLFAPMRLARAAIPVMRGQGHGRIINVTSMNDVLPAPFGGWYSASKAALASASAVLESEVAGFGIRVTVVAPGLFRTEMAEELDDFEVPDDSPYGATLEGLRRQNAARIPAAGDPDEVAAAIEACIDADEPPARVVVGADAESMEKLVRTTPPDEFRRLLREFVAALPAEPSDVS
jgi:NAD(P)-dependent dehydrogenase (short-subunit alcohol dehydrogenase family)